MKHTVDNPKGLKLVQELTFLSPMSPPEGLTVYIPGKIVRPLSWLHGPLAVFPDRTSVNSFLDSLTPKAFGWELWLVEYRPSRYPVQWVPVYGLALDSVDKKTIHPYITRPLPGVILADYICLLERVE